MFLMENKQRLTRDAVGSIAAGYGNDPSQLIAVLLDIQAASGRNYVDREWAEFVSARMGLPLSKVFDVLTFYSMFSTEPRGEFLIEICENTPCRFCGMRDVAGWFEAAAGIKVGQTSDDGKITLAYTSCVGACETGPTVKIGDEVYGNMDEEKAKALVAGCRGGHAKEVLPCKN